jgi:hypothetical protein
VHREQVRLFQAQYCSRHLINSTPQTAGIGKMLSMTGSSEVTVFDVSSCSRSGRFGISQPQDALAVKEANAKCHWNLAGSFFRFVSQ